MKRFILSTGMLLLAVTGALSQCWSPVWSSSSQDTMAFTITLATIDGTNLKSGDQIGIFDGAICVGTGTVNNTLSAANPLHIITLVDNSSTGPIDGYTAGHTITYRFCSSGSPEGETVTPTVLYGPANFAATTARDSTVVQLRAVNAVPSFTSSPVTAASQGSGYSYTPTATDPDGDVLTWSAPVLPSSGWLTFNPTTHVLSGTPTNDDVGDNNVTIRINDGLANVDQAFVISVANVNDDPTFTSIPVTDATQGSAYTYTATAEDIDGNTLTWSAPVLPGWLNFNTSTHVLSGTPTNDDVGDNNVTLRINDGTVNVDQSFVIAVANINDAPTFTSVPVTSADQGTTYTYTATAEDIDGNTLTWSAPVLPGWLNFNTGTHVLSGTPTNDDVGDHSVTLRINDGTVDVDQDFTISVANTNDAPTFTSTPVTSGTQDLAYTYTATAEDLDGDGLTWSAPVLPGWLNFNTGTHVLSGTPTNDDVGDNNVTLRVNDGTVNVDQSFVIAVANVNDAPTFTSTPVTSVDQGTAYTYTATAQDIDGNTLTWSAPVLPAWLNFNTSTHILSGTPSNGDVGDHSVTLRINDGTVNVDQSFTISVANVNDAPTFTSVPVTSGTQDLAYTYTATAEDLDGDGLTWSAPVLPAWLNFNTGTHVLSGTPTNDNVGNNNVTLRINDGTVNVDQSFVISVANINDPPTFTSTPVTTVIQDAAYNYTATAVDIDGNALTWSAPVLPAWLTFNTGTHILSGTPTNDNVGNNNVTLRINDGTVDVDQSFVISVTDINDPPTFTSTPVTAILQGVAYNYTATAEDVDGNALTWSAPVLPTWLTFNTSSHLLTGIPTNDDVGNHDVTIRVNDGTVDVDQVFVIMVSNENDPPTFTSTPVTSVLQGSAYNYTATAEDLDGNALTFSAPVLPASGWLTFNATTHILSGIPSNDDVGSHNVTIRVTDGIVDVDQAFVVTVDNINDPPTFTSVPVTAATQGIAYNYTATAVDVDGNALTWSAPVLPAWLTFNTITHVLSGTPGDGEVGDHNVTLRINDGTVDVDQSFVITVGNTNDPPVFTSTPITSATQGALYTYTAAATDVDGNTLTFSAPVLPAWLTFDVTTHVLSGTPANEHVGDHNVTLRVNDGTVDVDQSFVITVSNVNDPPSFTSTPVTAAVQGVEYSYTATAEDVDGNTLTWSAPVLPAWLSFDAVTHVLSGTPGNEHVGDNNVTLRVSDGTVDVDQAFVIVVNDTNDPPSFTSTPVTAATQDIAYTYTATATDPDGNTLTFSAPVLPSWLNFNVTSHVLSGTPDGTQVGDHPVTLRISDGIVDVDQAFVISVADVNDPPTFTSSPNLTAHVGTAYTYTPTAVDLDGDPITFSAPVLPAWLTFNSGTHTLSATPGNEHLGDHNVTLRVSDGTLATDQSFVLTVVEGNSAPSFTSDPATTAEVGTAYIYTMTAVDPDGDELTFSAQSLPAWLTFYPATNVISGTPASSDIGQHTVIVRVSDGLIWSDQTFYLTVVKANDPPTFTSSPVTTAVEGALYEYTVTADDVDGDALTFSAPSVPVWLSFNSGTHVLSGTPGYQDAGNYSVTLRVSDGKATVDQNFNISVENGTGVGIDDDLAPHVLLVYPNPTNGRFYIEVNRGFEEQVTLELIDAGGRVFLQKQVPPHQLIREEMNLSGEPAGMYFIRINHESGLLLGKVILQ